MAASLASYERDAEAAAAALQDVSYLLVERDNARRAGGPGAADLSGRLRGALVKMDRLVDGLERQLKLIEADVAAYGLTKREALSKRDALRKMTNERLRLRGLERTSVAASAAASSSAVSDKDALLARGGGGGGAGGGGGTPAPPQASPEELQQRTQMELREQDLQLDSLSKGLVGLKQMGLAISEETALQMKLIDDIEEGTDRGDAALKREAARAEHITQDTRTCCAYPCGASKARALCASARRAGARICARAHDARARSLAPDSDARARRARMTHARARPRTRPRIRTRAHTLTRPCRAFRNTLPRGKRNKTGLYILICILLAILIGLVVVSFGHVTGH